MGVDVEDNREAGRGKRGGDDAEEKRFDRGIGPRRRSMSWVSRMRMPARRIDPSLTLGRPASRGAGQRTSILTRQHCTVSLYSCSPPMWAPCPSKSAEPVCKSSASRSSITSDRGGARAGVAGGVRSSETVDEVDVDERDRV